MKERKPAFWAKTIMGGVFLALAVLMACVADTLPAYGLVLVFAALGLESWRSARNGKTSWLEKLGPWP